MKTRLSLAALALLCGCGTAAPTGGTIPLEQVPPDLVEVAKKEVRGLRVNSAYVSETDGRKVYEIRGVSSKGKMIEVDVDESGKVLSVD